MRALLFTLFTLGCAPIFAQTWNTIAGTNGTNVIHEDICIDPNTGDLYVAYVESSNNRATVKKLEYNNITSDAIWMTQGNADFGSGTSMLDIKIISVNDDPYVAIKSFTNPPYYDLIVYRLLSGVWTPMGSGPYQTTFSSDFSLKGSSANGIYLSFYNQTTSLISPLNELLTFQIFDSYEDQIGGLISDSFVDNFDIVIDGNNDVQVAHEYGDMSNYVQLSKNNIPTYDVNGSNLLDDYSDKIVTNLFGFDNLRFAAIEDGSSLVTRQANLTSGNLDPLYTVYNAPVDDYDMASDPFYDYFFLTSGDINIVECMASGTPLTLGDDFAPGSGSFEDPRIETWNNRLVVGFIRNGIVRVMEMDNPASANAGTAFYACEQVLSTAPTPSLIMDDNNYDHSNIDLTVSSMDIFSVPNSNIAILGTYPNYYLQLTSNPLSSTSDIPFEFQTMENGNSVDMDLFYVHMVNIGDVSITFPFTEMCENGPLVTLNTTFPTLPYGNPSGGYWTGTGVNSSQKFDPNLAGPGDHIITYVYVNFAGCIASTTDTITVNPIPNINIVSASATCGDDNGSANATISGGTPAYSIYWSNGATTEDISDLSAGLYFINVTDSKSCIASKPATVGTTGLVLSATTVGSNCQGDDEGEINLTISSAVAVESILWSNGETTEDISNLQAGTYEVTVTLIDGCISVASYEVTAPAEFIFDDAIVDATCGGNDGSVTTSVTGGTAPYTYQWFIASPVTAVGTNSEILDNISGNSYFLILTDFNGCSTQHNLVVSENGGPDVVVSSVVPAECSNDGAINIAINSVNPVSTILWNSGQTVEDISALSPGYYTVEVTDILGCSGFASAEVFGSIPELIPICLVTVDTLTNTNLLVWEKPVTTDISHFNIYRETSVAGSFQYVATVPYADESVYNDLVASPTVRSWRYKITTVDLCGVESDMSEFHKTIHLTIGLGLGNTINLNWDDYEGFSVSTYDIYRYTVLDGWNLIQQMPSNLYSYVDSPPTITGLDYFISVTPPSTCTSTNKAQDHNSSRSNKSNTITGPLVNIEEDESSAFMNVFPNPSNGEFVLVVNPDLVSNYQIQITDATGRIVYEYSSSGASTTINLSNFSSGVYHMQIFANDQVFNKKLIKQ